jgi:hypothetical protein
VKRGFSSYSVHIGIVSLYPQPYIMKYLPTLLNVQSASTTKLQLQLFPVLPALLILLALAVFGAVACVLLKQHQMNSK